jgi:hypothetical protein
MKRKQGALLVAYEIIKKKMGNEENHGDNGSDEKRKWYDPQKRNRLLERRAPVVELFIVQTILLQIERKLEDVIDIESNTEAVRKSYIAPLQPKGLNACRSEKNMCEDCHSPLMRIVK